MYYKGKGKQLRMGIKYKVDALASQTLVYTYYTSTQTMTCVCAK